MLALAAAALAAHGLPALAHPAAFSIDQVMQAPFPSSLVAASGARAVAWVFDDRGSRNVWVADAAHQMKGHAVTTFTGDDGLNIGELAWSADTKLLAFTRGGSLEDDRPANTDSSYEGPTPREVWIVASAGGMARKLHAGHSAVFSPDSSRVVFLDGGRIWSCATDGSGAPQTLLVDAGQLTWATFSPDGQRLAFLSQRTQHALVGIYDLQTRGILWMSPSLDQDSSPVFSPTGAQIAFIRVPSEHNEELTAHRTGEPWSIWVADAQTGTGRRVWVADMGTGSVFHPTESEQNLLWARGNRLVFPWEKSGWLQLYAVPASGGRPVPLTSGSFEIAHLALSPDRSHLVYSSNQADADRRHVWSIGLEGSLPVAVGRDSAIEDSPQMSSDGTLYAVQSDAARPLQPVMLAGGRWQPLAPQSLPATFPQAALVKPESVGFPAHDGQMGRGQIFVPQARDSSGKHPALLFFHGGPQRQMLLGFHPMDAYSFMYAVNQYFVSEGYIVLSVSYRGGTGYGLDFREAQGIGPGGASEVNDLLGAIAYLKERPDVDARRIGIWGGSYGGLMTALGLARASRDIAAGVDYAGVYNWATLLVADGSPPPNAQAARLAEQSSPSATIDAWRSPVLVVQADDDRDVPFSQSADLLEALRSHHIEHDELILPNEIHDLSRYASWLSFFAAADRYFARYLQAPEAGAPHRE
jgi:dipeptidyl aminopeptidase/acylaminoacyl peptidase